MVEIRYGEHYEMADLTGKSVAQAREQYKQEFDIPDKTQAKLNGKGIRQKHEPKTALSHNDSLTFARKSRKGLFFIGAILLALAITGGVFAYGATTATVGLTVTGTSDFAVVTPGAGASWTAFGSFKGQVGTGDLFTITPTAGWTGDMSVVLTLTNAYKLVEAYRILVLEIQVYDDGTSNPATGATTEYLTLSKGDIDIQFSLGTGPTYTVKLTDGFYITHRSGWGAAADDPSIYCQVLQRSS